MLEKLVILFVQPNDPAYVAWLEAIHPEAVPANPYMLTTAPATSGGVTKTLSTSLFDSTSSVPDTFHNSGA